MSDKFNFLKNLSNAVLFSGLLIASVFNGNAQQSDTFEEKTLDALKKTAYQKMESKIYRVTVNETIGRKDNPTSVKDAKYIREVIPPDRSHYISMEKTSDGVKRYEYIRIGEKSFSRTDDGEWKDITGSGSGQGSGNGSGDSVKFERSVERKLKRGVSVKNQTTDLYETVITTKFLYPASPVTNIGKYSYWFDANGMLVKTEDAFSTDDTTQKIVNRVSEYEYDARIKIEAPVINKSAPKKTISN